MAFWKGGEKPTETGSCPELLKAALRHEVRVEGLVGGTVRISGQRAGKGRTVMGFAGPGLGGGGETPLSRAEPTWPGLLRPPGCASFHFPSIMSVQLAR